MVRSSKEAFNLEAEVDLHRREAEIKALLHTEEARDEARAVRRQIEEDQAAEREKSAERLKSMKKGLDPYKINNAYHEDLNRQLREEHDRLPRALKRLETRYRQMLGTIVAKQIKLAPDWLKPKPKLTYNPDPATARKAVQFATRFARAVADVSPFARLMTFNQSARRPQIVDRDPVRAQPAGTRKTFDHLLDSTAATPRTSPPIMTVAPHIAAVVPGFIVTPAPVMAEPAEKPGQAAEVKPEIAAAEEPSPSDIYNGHAAAETAEQAIEPPTPGVEAKSPADLYNEAAAEPEAVVDHTQHQFEYSFDFD